jgi:ABC-type tungstate transport system substrate-binding protein
MSAQRVNQASLIGLIVLSLTALATVIIGLALPALTSTRGPLVQADEGTGAHIFQLSIVALMPVGLVFLATEDWTQPLRSLRRLALPATAVVLAFGVLYFFEHLR